MENSLPLAAVGIGDFYAAVDLNDLAATMGRFNEHCRESEIETGDMMEGEVNDIIFGGGLEVIIKGNSYL